MKKIIILLFISFAFAKVQAQTFNNYADTANYLIHEIENKKSLFVGKPLSVLLHSLKMQPVDAYTGASRLKSDFGKSVSFYFNWERIFDKKHFLIVIFNSVPSYGELFPLLYPAVGERTGLQGVINIYDTLIIKDVLVKDYTNDIPPNPGVQY